MADRYPPQEIYFPRPLSATEVERINDSLDGNSLGRPLTEPSRSGQVTVLAVAGADAAEVTTALRKDPRSADAQISRIYRGATDLLVGDFRAAGRSWGHGLLFTPLDGAKSGDIGVSMEPVWDGAYRRPLPPWDPPKDHRAPVIALLDSGVLDHEQLPPRGAAVLFVAEESQTSLPNAQLRKSDDHVKMAYGHATFIAGLIRMQAPTAQVWSHQIMDSSGHITEAALVDALDKLIEYRRGGNRLDVVCMAFGEHLDPGEEPPAVLRDKLSILAGQRGVRLVAAAGNAGTDEPVYPAAFAQDIARLDSVGAGPSSDDRDFYSGYGKWVTCWRDGTATSIMPRRPDDLPAGEHEYPFPCDGWAQWQGTSFAVARRAAELAKEAA